MPVTLLEALFAAVVGLALREIVDARRASSRSWVLLQRISDALAETRGALEANIRWLSRPWSLFRPATEPLPPLSTELAPLVRLAESTKPFANRYVRGALSRVMTMMSYLNFLQEERMRFIARQDPRHVAGAFPTGDVILEVGLKNHEHILREQSAMLLQAVMHVQAIMAVITLDLQERRTIRHPFRTMLIMPSSAQRSIMTALADAGEGGTMVHEIDATNAWRELERLSYLQVAFADTQGFWRLTARGLLLNATGKRVWTVPRCPDASEEAIYWEKFFESEDRAHLSA